MLNIYAGEINQLPHIKNKRTMMTTISISVIVTMMIVSALMLTAGTALINRFNKADALAYLGFKMTLATIAVGTLFAIFALVDFIFGMGLF